MNGSFVSDACLAVAWVVPSQSSEAADKLLRDVAAGASLVVPVLWAFEVANALLVLVRRKRISPQQCVRARRALSRLNPVVDDEGPRAALDTIAELAFEHGLSVYDATYLELALRRRLPLASRDARLNRAARRCGFTTLL